MSVTLNQMKVGQKASIKALYCTGINRRRMMDLGILPGTVIEAAFVSPLNDPVAYRVRDTLIALRREQAKEIEIELLEGDKS
jgi:Fe2+ transport system protein FeoA